MEAGDDLHGAEHAETGRAGVGALLRARRVELGMTHADVANAVKLPSRRIEAMEEERWDELPGGTYLRGFLRNVARVLQLDPTTLLDRVDGASMRTRTPESILAPRGATRATLPKRSGPIDDRNGGRRLVFGAFVFAIVAALIAWSGTESFDRVVSGGQALIAARKGDAPAAPHEPAPTTVVEAKPAPATGDPAIVPGATPAPNAPADLAATTTASTTAAATASGDLALVFHFNEDSWVEVKSADGRVLLHRLNVAGSDQKIDGEAPFSLIVGNAKGVALRFRGQPVDLGPYTRDQVARLTLS